MPSGRGAGGGGGSHFGGGGGSRRGGSSCGNSARYSRPMVFWFFGRRYYLPLGVSNAVRGLLSAALIMAIAFFMFFCSLRDNKGKLGTIVYDHNRYISMIEYAKENPDYQKEGIITAVRYNSYAKKYYFEYSIPMVGYGGYYYNGQFYTGNQLMGYTYSVYSAEEIKNFRIGQILIFAVDVIPVTTITDSINFGYEDIPLSADGEYVQIKKQILLLSVVCAVLGAATLAVLGVAVFKAVKNAKEKQEVAENCATETDFKGEKVVRCAYCGSIMENGQGKCKNCGATIQPDDK